MKKHLILGVWSLLAMVGTHAQSNLGNLAKDKLKNKSKTESAAPAEASPKNDSASGRSPMSRDAGGAKNSTVELDFDSEPFKAAVSWKSLLSEQSRYFNATNGEFKLNNLDVSFLPKKTKSGQDVKYESYNNPTPLLRMDVIDAATKEVKGTLYYGAAQTTPPFHNMSLIEKQGMPYSVKLTEGSYELHFWAGTTHFYTFPIRVEKLTNSDPYAPVSTFYHLKGAWEEWGYVDFGPDGHFIFNFYHTYQTTQVENAARWDVRKAYKYMVKVNRDGKMVGVHQLSSSSTEPQWGDIQADNCVWKKYDMTFHAYPPPSSGPNNRPFLLKDNLKDGEYTVEVFLKEEKTNKETNYKYAFTVKNGSIVPADKADRSKNTDMLQFLEQGRTRFYVERIN